MLTGSQTRTHTKQKWNGNIDTRSGRSKHATSKNNVEIPHTRSVVRFRVRVKTTMMNIGIGLAMIIEMISDDGFMKNLDGDGD